MGLLLLLYLGFRHFRSICCSEFERCDTLDLKDNRLPWKAALYGLPQRIFRVYEESKGEGVKVIFVGGRKLLPVEKNEDGSENITLIHKVLFVMEILFINSISIIFCASLIFWDIFLVEQTFGCNPGLDCYELRDRSPIQQSPIVSCADSVANVTIECFRFTFQYGTGFAAFGGLLKFGETVLWIFVSISVQGIDLFMSKNIAKRIGGCVVLFIAIISPHASLIIGLIYISVVYVREAAKLFNNIVYIITFSLLAFYVASLVTVAFLLPKRKSFDPPITLTGNQEPQHRNEEVLAANSG